MSWITKTSNNNILITAILFKTSYLKYTGHSGQIDGSDVKLSYR